MKRLIVVGLALVVALGLGSGALAEKQDFPGRHPWGAEGGRQGRGFQQRGRIGSPELREEMARLHQEIKKLAMEYQKSENPKEQEKIKAKIETQLSALFDARQAAQEEGLREMEENLGKLRESVKARAENKEERVKAELEKVLNKATSKGKKFCPHCGKSLTSNGEKGQRMGMGRGQRN